MDDDNRLITVCDSCLMATCWYWEFPCDNARYAGTIKLPISKLKELNREHPSYWTLENVEKYTGVHEA